MNTIELPHSFYRPGTHTTPKRTNFVLTHGGIGDYVHWTVALTWAAKYNPQVQANVYCPPYFTPLAEKIFAPYPAFSVYSSDQLTDEQVQSTPTFLPNQNFTLNGMGTHLTDLGFVYYANMHSAPDYHKELPNLDSPSSSLNSLPPLPELPENLKNKLPEDSKYIVLTPVYSYENRKMPFELFNDIVSQILDNGYTPVFVGSSKIGSRDCHIDSDYNLFSGVNLLNETSLFEAFQIMQHSSGVIGVDNGLLHVAALSHSTPIAFGYTVIGPKFRRPYRNPNAAPIIDIAPDSSQLSCTFCMSKMRYFYGHNYNYCIYKDNACVAFLLNEKEKWMDAVDLFCGVKQSTAPNNL